MGSRKKNRKKRHRPYEQIKMKFFHLGDPFGNAPMELRRAAIHGAGTNARASFNAEYPKMATWFETYDPLYLLSFCAYYFLSSPEGVDREAIDGKLDFASYHLELLQAFALMRPRGGTPKPLAERTEELQRYMRDLGDSLALAQMDFPADLPVSEVTKLMVISEMRTQTFAIRNWAYPDQMLGHLRSVFAGALAEIIAAEYQGVSIVRVIDALKILTEQIEGRLNDHIRRLRPVVAATDFDSAYSAYVEAFPDIQEQREGMREVFEGLCRTDLGRFQSFLLMHSDLRLPLIYTFSVDEATRAYGDESGRAGLAQLLRAWSHEFGDLASRDPMHFLYGNPVLQRPLIRAGEESFYWALCGLYAHTLPAMLEFPIPMVQRDRYLATRSRYLEDQVEMLCRKAFPNGRVYRGSQFRLTPGEEPVYENDILVLIDSTAIIVECKAHLVDAPARRGGELRLVDTLEDLVVSASQQAHRFMEFLKANPRRHAFDTKSGHINNVNASRILRFIPVSVTYENLGFVSANLKNAVEAGLIEPGQPLVPSICFTDLEVILDTLDSQAERIHYLARRAEIERAMAYRGDELDLFALYVDTGFGLGELEGPGHFLDMGLKSKELDPYFVGRANGVSVPKPKLKLTEWWRQTLARIEDVRNEFWTEVAYVFLSVAYEDQQKFEQQFSDLKRQVKRGLLQEHRWVAMVSGTRSQRQYGVIGFPHGAITRDMRNGLMKHAAAEFERDRQVFGTVVLAIDVDAPHYPYEALMFVPGHAPGAISFGRLVPRHPGGGGSGAPDYCLRSPRPRP